MKMKDNNDQLICVSITHSEKQHNCAISQP